VIPAPLALSGSVQLYAGIMASRLRKSVVAPKPPAAWLEDSKMLTQYSIQTRLDVIANEVSQIPGLYYELYSRQYSARVHDWMRTVSPADAELIQRVAAEDPDYQPNVGMMAPVYAYARPAQSFNPAWDMDY
jgi:hypothetical protein